MEQKRVLAFLVLSAAIFIGWNHFVLPLIRPQPKPAAKKNLAKDEKKPEVAPKAGQDATVATADKARDAGAKEDPSPAVEAVAKKDPKAELPNFPPTTVVLGSDKPTSDFRQAVTLTSLGAAIEKIELNDPRYRTLTDRDQPLTLVGADTVRPLTLAMTVPQIAPDVDLNQTHWEVVPDSLLPAEQPHDKVTFRLRRTDELLCR